MIQHSTFSKKLSSRRPNLNFKEMGIEIGATLQFTQSDATVTVASERKVILNGEETSLTNATRTLLNNGTYNVAPAPYWTHNGRNLRELYNETYEMP